MTDAPHHWWDQIDAMNLRCDISDRLKGLIEDVYMDTWHEAYREGEESGYYRGYDTGMDGPANFKATREL